MKINLIRIQNKNNFIINSNIIHPNNAYGYELVKYSNNKTKVIIKCNTCGSIFSQTPNSHLSGQGCDKCGRLLGIMKRTKNKEIFICNAHKIHRFKFNYGKFVYITAKTKGIIICNNCKKEFLQDPNKHLLGRGCPHCSKRISSPEFEFLNYINIPNDKTHRQVKITNKKVDGYDPTTNTIYEFLGDYWHGNPVKFKPDYINKTCKKTAQELYDNTFLKFNTLKSLGYNIKYIWETDWKNYIKGIDKEPRIIDY